MKNKLMNFEEKLMLRKKSIIEIINDIFKNPCDCEYSQHKKSCQFLY